MKIKLQEIAQMCGGKLFGDENMEITSLFTDSREAEKGKLFVPIVGEKVDAHNFIDSVFEKGCASFSQNIIENPIGSYILVENSKKALQEFALKYRQSFNIPFVAVTGSVGKTTSKEMIALAIESEKNTLKTLGNANSQIGLPFTILRTEQEHECAVIEMGMSLPEEMGRISYCARPNIAVITNIGVSHIEFHGSREKILEEKLHITDYFTSENTLFVNGDDDLLCKLKGTTNYKVVEFGISENCDYRAINVEQDENGSKFTCVHGEEHYEMYVPVVGIHNVRNALASLAVAQSVGVSAKSVIEAIEKYTAPQMRQQIKKTEKFIIIDDTYNASPDSAKASIDVLATLKGKRKILIVGDMLELGSYSQKAHEEVGAYARKSKIDHLISFGIEAENCRKSFLNTENSNHFLIFDKAEQFVKDFAKNGDVFLIKGSRGMKMDRFVKVLEEV